mgnify:CR=1 FL=1
MKCLLLSVALLVGMSAVAVQANAGERGYRGDSGYKKSRGGPKVKGYTKRRGGYSYDYLDTINTYGNVDEFRDPDVDRQSIMGPFDSGFFFDSATGLAGGSAPYMN